MLTTLVGSESRSLLLQCRNSPPSPHLAQYFLCHTVTVVLRQQNPFRSVWSPKRAGTAPICTTGSTAACWPACRPSRSPGAKKNCIAALESGRARPPRARLQTSVVSGHKADFGLMLMDPDPLKIDAVHQRLMSRPLGPALVPTYSFVSMTEVSEYVPTVEQYGQRLVAEGRHRRQPRLSGQGEGLRRSRCR